jgi:hypothetical protein
MRFHDVSGNISQALLLGVKTGAVQLAAGEEAFLWAFSHPTLLRNCSQNWTYAAGNVTRLRVYLYHGRVSTSRLNLSRLWSLKPSNVYLKTCSLSST